MKSVNKYRGINSPKIDSIFKDIWNTENMKELPLQTIWDVGFNLMKSEFGEDKQLGASIHNKIAKNLTVEHINEIRGLF